jgi:hypothetical protein
MSNGLENGLAKHKFDPKTGAIREIEDIKTRPRQRPKAVSSRQWADGRQRQ